MKNKSLQDLSNEYTGPIWGWWKYIQRTLQRGGWLALAVFIREIMGLMIICFVYGNTRTNPPRPVDFKIRHDPSLPRFYLSFKTTR